MIKTERGGQGKVALAGRRNVGATTGVSTKPSTFSNILSSVAGIIETIGTKRQAEKKQYELEDKIMLQNRAQSESTDIDNAMLGGSYDTTLNDKVAEWQGAGQNESTLRTNIKNYKFGQGIENFGLTTGEESNDAINAYFETLSDIELKKVTPLLQADNAKVTKEVGDAVNNSLSIGMGDLQTRFSEGREVAGKYKISEDIVGTMTITSAFRKARNGDTKDLDELSKVVNSEGIPIINTIQGAELFDQLTQAKETKDYNDIIRQDEANKKAEIAVSESLYTKLVSGDIENVKVLIDASLKGNKINPSQHASLLRTYKDLLPESIHSFPKDSNMSTYGILRADAELGVLPLDTLESFKGHLSASDYKAIVNLSLQKGGAYGVGNTQNDIIEDDIKNFANDNAGVNLQSSIISDINGFKLGEKRASLTLKLLREAKANYVLTNKELPNEEALDKMKNKVLTRVDKTLGTISVAGGAVKPVNTSTTYTDIIKDEPALNDAGWNSWYSKLTPQQKESYKKGN